MDRIVERAPIAAPDHVLGSPPRCLPRRAIARLAGLALALTLLALICGACTSSDDGDDHLGADTALADTSAAADVQGDDTAGPDDDARTDDTRTDDTALADTAEPDTEPGDAVTGGAEFVLGTNTVYENLPEHFFVLEDGAEMPVTFGSQAAWMVVLAFKSRGIFEGEVRVAASIDIEGERFGELELVGQHTMLYPDGYAYYFNFWLVINTPGQPEQGKLATVTMTVEDDAGHSVTEVRQVVVGPATN